MLPQVAVALILVGCSPNARDQPSWDSGKDNIAYAISAICAPYVFDRVEASQLPLRQTLVRDDGWHESAFEKAGSRPVRVGYAGFVHVAVSETEGGRQCQITGHPLFAPASMTVEDARAAKTPAVNAQTLRTAAADAQALRAAALKALAKRPEDFSPSKTRYSPGRFASEDMLCASARRTHPGGFALISAAGAEHQGTVLLTVQDGPDRSPSCDRKAAPLNSRTLASTAE